MALKESNKNRKKKEKIIEEVNSKDLSIDNLKKIILGIALLMLVIYII